MTTTSRPHDAEGTAVTTPPPPLRRAVTALLLGVLLGALAALVQPRPPDRGD